MCSQGGGCGTQYAAGGGKGPQREGDAKQVDPCLAACLGRTGALGKWGSKDWWWQRGEGADVREMPGNNGTHSRAWLHMALYHFQSVLPSRTGSPFSIALWHTAGPCDGQVKKGKLSHERGRSSAYSPTVPGGRGHDKTHICGVHVSFRVTLYVSCLAPLSGGCPGPALNQWGDVPENLLLYNAPTWGCLLASSTNDVDRVGEVSSGNKHCNVPLGFAWTSFPLQALKLKQAGTAGRIRCSALCQQQSTAFVPELPEVGSSLWTWSISSHLCGIFQEKLTWEYTMSSVSHVTS